MVLKTKSILEPPSNKDGIRISVMRRHTLNDGVTPDDRINPQSYERWHQDLAPPATLLREYYQNNLSWGDYTKKYIQCIRSPEIFKQVNALASEALEKTITLLCIENTAKKCHRRLLAEECKRHVPDLKLEIN